MRIKPYRRVQGCRLLVQTVFVCTVFSLRAILITYGTVCVMYITLVLRFSCETFLYDSVLLEQRYRLCTPDRLSCLHNDVLLSDPRCLNTAAVSIQQLQRIISNGADPSCHLSAVVVDLRVSDI